MELFLSFLAGVISSALVSYIFYKMQKKTDDILLSSAELQRSSTELIRETQELHSLRTGLLRNQQDVQTEMLKLSDHLSHHIKEQVEDLLLGIKYPEFFSSTSVIDLTPEETENNSDIPRIGHFLVDGTNLKPGNEVSILFRVNDDKWNFPVPSGATVFHDGGKITPLRASAKYMKFTIEIPEDFSKPSYDLNLTLKDSNNNENDQLISIPLEA